jgi:hypothetical protein
MGGGGYPASLETHGPAECVAGRQAGGWAGSGSHHNSAHSLCSPTQRPIIHSLLAFDGDAGVSVSQVCVVLTTILPPGLLYRSSNCFCRLCFAALRT